MSKQFWGVIIAIIVVFAGIFALTGGKSDNSSSGGSKDQPTNHVTGKGTTGVTILEYGDYQCPYCEQYEPTVQQVIDKYQDQIKFQFRNFPLTNAHPNAFAAARAAEAAALQNKFWEMHDLLYDSTYWQQWTVASDPTTHFDQYAQQLKLNLVQFKKDYASSIVNNSINADMAAGTKAGVTGTPTFFINGKKAEVTATVDSFSKAIDDAIASQKSKQ